MLSSTRDKIMPFKNLPLKFLFRCINRSPSYGELQNALCYYSDLLALNKVEPLYNEPLTKRSSRYNERFSLHQ